MNISPLGQSSPITRLHGSKATGGTQGSQDAGRIGQDTVQISDVARYLGEIKKLPDIRQDKVDAVKAQIASGTYETSDKIDSVVNSLLEHGA